MKYVSRYWTVSEFSFRKSEDVSIEFYNLSDVLFARKDLSTPM